MEALELAWTQHGERASDGFETYADDLPEELLAFRGEDALDDAPVVRAVLASDQAVPFDAPDEARGSCRTEIERLRDGAHRQRATAKQEQEAELAEGQVPDGRRRNHPRHALEDLEEVDGGRGQTRIWGQ